MGRVVTIPYRPRPQQKEIHKNLKRFNVLVCHRRFGKTVFAINEILKTALTSTLKRPRVAYIAPTYSQAKRVVWDYVREFATPVPGVKFNEAELRADFPNGARLQLGSADNPDTMRGQYFDQVVLDEYAQHPPRMWGEVIRPALSDREGGAIFIGTPQGHNNFYDIYVKACDLEDWYTAVHKASETEIIPEKELRAARHEMSPEEYDQEYECSWSAAIRGAYYARTIAENEDQITNVPYDKNARVHTSWDLGMADEMAIWFMQWAGKELHVIDYYENSGEGLPHYFEVLDKKGYLYGDHIAPHDIKVRELGSGKSRLEVAKGLGIKFKVAPNLKVADGIEAVRSLLPRCWFDRVKTHQGLEALRQYRSNYNEKMKVFSNTPLHDWTSHASDAFRYFAIAHKPAKRKWEKLDYGRTPGRVR